ncbi:hypothetical protein ACHAXA_005419 [Cyclostephanos tholiformis]|uniref:Uncharacterized protein n=1 Tax=Cyclostephanos tholiformis TaxID=382380 RepID=A0ABD3RA03_9STRA
MMGERIPSRPSINTDASSTNLRSSMNSEDIEEDRRLIMRKIQQRRRGGDRAAGGDGPPSRPSMDSSRGAFSEGDDYGEDEDDYVGLGSDRNGPAIDDEGGILLREAREWHMRDELSIGGKVEEDGGDREEGLEAMKRALTNRPVSWWGMRKQWQRRRGGPAVTSSELVAVGGMPIPFGSGGDIVAHDHDGGRDDERDVVATGGPLDWDACAAHPVLLEDPTSIGYDMSSFRRGHPHSANGSSSRTTSMRRRRPAVIYVTRDVVNKRRAIQGLYLLSSMCVVCIFGFVLSQRKLSNYAMVASPMSLSEYLAGEGLMTTANVEGHDAAGHDEYYDYGETGDQSSAAIAGLGDIELNPIDPLANEVLANDPLVGNHMTSPSTPAVDRFEQLKRVVVGRGISPEEVFANPASAQFRALDWLANDDVLRYMPASERWSKKIVQRYTLATIYYATNGQGWKNTLYFLSNRDECDWNRVYMGYFSGAGRCNKEGYITALALWGNYLKGALPPEIGSLTSLRTLSVFDNMIAVHPPESLVKLTSVTRLYLQKNSFQGDVNFLCQLKIPDLKADCGERGGVLCSCCIACGYNEKNDKGNMVDRFITR